MLHSKKEMVAIIILFDIQSVNNLLVTQRYFFIIEIRYILSQFLPKYDFNKTQKFISNYYDMFVQSFHSFFPIFWSLLRPYFIVLFICSLLVLL